MGTRIETWARDLGIRSIRVVGPRRGIQHFCLIPTTALRRYGLNGHPDPSSVGCHRMISEICRWYTFSVHGHGRINLLRDSMYQVICPKSPSPKAPKKRVGSCPQGASVTSPSQIYPLQHRGPSHGHGGDSWPTRLSVGEHWDCTRVVPCVWDAAISRRRCAHGHSLPSVRALLNQAALAGAWKKTSWLSAKTFAGGVEVRKMNLR
jgi:hypothetical protein